MTVETGPYDGSLISSFNLNLLHSPIKHCCFKYLTCILFQYNFKIKINIFTGVKATPVFQKSYIYIKLSDFRSDANFPFLSVFK